MVIWWLKHLAVLFKGKMTFHSGIRNWKHQAELVQKQSMRITIHLINDLNIKSERVLREAATWDEKSPFIEQRIGMSPGSGTLRLGSLQEEFCRVWSHPGKARSHFQSSVNVLNLILTNSRVGEAEKAPIHRGFSTTCFFATVFLQQLDPVHYRKPEQPGLRELSLPVAGVEQDEI